MANEYLKRTPTSSGNRKVFTFSVWYKRLSDNGATDSRYFFLAGDTHVNLRGSGASNPDDIITNQRGASTNYFYHYAPARRDYSSWQHLLYAVDTTQTVEKHRGRVYINGVEQIESSSIGSSNAPLNDALSINNTVAHFISEDGGDDGTYSSSLQLFDAFLVDGQALTPDVFGFYKEGDGYVSAGSTQATDFRPGQWVPKRPRIIKTEIERRGGFGVNGFYLPMNDSSNPGADFHCDPNSIITLKGEDLPQPRNGAPTTTDAYVSQLRQEVSTLGFDGVVKFDGNGDYLSLSTTSDFAFGTDDFTVEFWAWIESSQSSTLQPIFDNDYNSAGGIAIAIRHSDSRIFVGDNESGLGLNLCQFIAPFALNSWNHFVVVADGGTYKAFVNGVACSLGSGSTTVVNTTRSSGTTEIGRLVGQTSIDAQCFISNLRVVKGTAVYTSNFTAPTEPLTNVTNTVLLCCNSSTSATAATVTPGTITANGDVLASRNELTGSITLAVPGISTATGNNLIANGNFDSTDLSDWTTTDNTQSWNNGQLQINRTGGGGGTSYQAFTTEVGKRYTVIGTVNSSGSRGDLRIYDGTGFGGTLLLILSGTNGQTTTQTGSFTAASTISSLAFSVDNNSTTIYVDNIVVKQEDAPRDYSADIRGSGTNKEVQASLGRGGVGYELGGYYGSSINAVDNNCGHAFSGADGAFVCAGDFTVELWLDPVVATQPIGNPRILGQTNNTGGKWDIYIDSTSSTNRIYTMGGSVALTGGSGSGYGNFVPGQWNHFCLERHGSIMTTYMNGVAVYSQTYTNTIGTTDFLYLGSYGDQVAAPGYGITGKIQDFRFYKGVAKYKGGFDVPKPYTPVGFEGDSWRTVADCTANNFATLNSIGSGLLDYDGDSNTSATYSNGNLTAVLADNAASARSTIGIHTGKWYWETRIDVNSNSCGVGIVGLTTNSSSYSDVEGASYEPRSDRFRKAGTTFYDGTNNYTDNGLIVGIALDKNVGIISFFADGTLQSSGTMTGLNALSKYHLPECFTHNDASSNTFTLNYGQNPTFSGQVTAGTNADDSGKGLFKYAPPSGFLALCEDNLPAPAIADPGDYFKTVLYTGSDDNGGKSITGVGFKPDFVWVKNRNISSGHYLWDVVRGTDANLRSDDTFTEVDVSAASNGIISTNASDGFVVKNGGTSGTNVGSSGNNSYVAWCWKAGGAAVSNTDGSIPSQVSANQDAGFSIVSYTGTGANATVGHELGKKPSFIVVKERYSPSSSISSWQVYHSSLGATQRIQLNLTNTADTVSNIWNDTEPTSDVFTIGSSGAINENTGTYIAYCWAEVEGFSKFGSYVSNGDADGPFVYCGFKPAWVMAKRTVGGNASWAIQDSSRDSTNPTSRLIQANEPDVEHPTVGYWNVDFVSNGFKIRNNDGLWNDGTYIFAAFAESPFKTANAK